MPSGLRSGLRCTLLLVALAITRMAGAQVSCTNPSFPNDSPCRLAERAQFLGDLNADGLVNGDDTDFWSTCIVPTGYCLEADYNLNGELDPVDLEYLNRIREISPGGVPQLPKAYLNEIRTAKPTDQTNSLIKENRYVEIAVRGSAPLVAFPDPRPEPRSPALSHTLFGPGWFYIKVCRSVGPGGTNPPVFPGTVALVIDLEGLPVVTDLNCGAGSPCARALAMVIDSTFELQPDLSQVPPSTFVSRNLGPLPSGVDVYSSTPGVNDPFMLKTVPTLRIPGTIGTKTLPPEQDTNVTHLLVYRDPASTKAFPSPGQQIIPKTVPPPPDEPTQYRCEDIPFLFVDPTTLDELPPWDVVVDAVTLVKTRPGNVNAGCIFASTPDDANNLGPVGTVGNQFQPLHPLRCRNLNTFRKGPEAVVKQDLPNSIPGSDTPYSLNPRCSSPDIVENCGQLNPDGTYRSCFEPNAGPYCSDPDCCVNVCDQDPTCCGEAWDQDCATLALTACATCEATTASCFTAHPTPSCSNVNCCNEVCTPLPQCCAIAWDQECVDLARTECLDCGSELTGACDVVHDLPFCTDTLCCNEVCKLNEACCTITWDAACVQIAETACGGCGSLGTGSCCIVHPTPYCSDSECCGAVCKADPFCCITSWDYECTQIASIEPACEGLGCVCGFPAVPGAPFSCFAVHELPGCENAYCCQAVCLRDSYCCYVEWDASCVRAADDLCATNPGCFNQTTTFPVNGSCFVPRLTPGCDTPGCCDLVCALDGFSYCCDTLWDEACVEKATENCNDCGDPFSGSCFTLHTGPNCADADCCRTVCLVDNFCCEGTWDGLCVSTAEALCLSPIKYCGDDLTRSCWVPSYLPGCQESECCREICGSIDPFCCESRWDAVCAREAGFLCTTSKYPPDAEGTEGCQSVHASPGCANPECTLAVCSVDATCCEVAWDIDCVLATYAVCPSPTSCPAPGDCFEEHSNSGCSDPSCCNGVCSVDPTCCESIWDSGCAQLADQWCKVPPDSGFICPCQGGCFEEHGTPGCDDGSCCSIVCNINPVCCSEEWDADCVAFARDFCCGSPGCGSGCNGPCLVAHPDPFCSEPYCCAAVCELDPICCSSSWDALCVSGAVERCATQCGMETAGDCFLPRGLPACNDGTCCAAVCGLDPYCCQAEWDDNCVNEASKLPLDCRRAECGDPDSGDPCEPHPSPASNNLACCKLVCAEDDYCCTTEWDATCVQLALGKPECGCFYECGDTCAGDCCRAHDNQACADADCCAAVCQVDSYCCDTLWDAACASDARAICTAEDEACPLPPCGSDLLPSCCTASNAPNCSDESCCEAVCAVDPLCCTTIWDSICVDEAAAIPSCKCNGPACGDPDAGSCFETHSNPFCADANCCLFVCAFETTCCSVGWDQVCVDLATSVCGATPFTDMVNGYGNALRGGAGPKAPTGRGPPPGWVPVRERMRARTKLPPGIPLPPPRTAPRPEFMDDDQRNRGPAPAGKVGTNQGAAGPAMPGATGTQQLPAGAAKKPGKG